MTQRTSNSSRPDKPDKHHTASPTLDEPFAVIAKAHALLEPFLEEERKKWLPSNLPKLPGLASEEIGLLWLEAEEYFMTTASVQEYVTLDQIQLRAQSDIPGLATLTDWLAEALGEACARAIGLTCRKYAKHLTQAVIARRPRGVLPKGLRGKLYAASLFLAISLSKQNYPRSWALSAIRSIGAHLSWLGSEFERFSALLVENTERHWLSCLHESDRGIRLGHILHGVRFLPPLPRDHLKTIIDGLREKHPDWGHRRIAGKIDDLYASARTRVPIPDGWRLHGHDGMVTAYDCPVCRPKVQTYVGKRGHVAQLKTSKSQVASSLPH